MGVMIVEQQQPASAVRSGDGADKKKKRRSNRRSKQNSPSLPGAACNSVNVLQEEDLKSLENGEMSRSCSSNQQGLNKELNANFNSFPTIYIDDWEAKSDAGLPIFSQSCPTTVSFEESVSLLANKDFVDSHLVLGCTQHKPVFDQHWSLEAVNEALEKGEVFQATFRVNAHNRLEAYCTIEGVPVDVLLNGVAAQNRAVEGDTVAVKVDPPSLWTRLKGSTGFSSSSTPPKDDNSVSGSSDIIVGDNLKGKSKVDANCECASRLVGNCSPLQGNGYRNVDHNFLVGTACPQTTGSVSCSDVNCLCISGPLVDQCYTENNRVMNAVQKLCDTIIASPFRRPTGQVVAIIELSPRRKTVVGFVSAKQWISRREYYRKDDRRNKNLTRLNCGYIQLSPSDPRFPKMVVPVAQLPDFLKRKLDDGDPTVEMELVGAHIDGWEEDSFYPRAKVMHTFGHGVEMKSQIAAILFENAICSAEFSSDSLSCLPRDMSEVLKIELEKRQDLRDLCIFTIDPSTATDLDDALSVEWLAGDLYRVGVHIADVSYFVLPDTALDMEAQFRSTSVYMLQQKLPMLPPLLSENLGSLNPGVDRLAFSIFWDINLCGTVVNRWISRTVVRSCCKLSYEHAQDIIDGRINVDGGSILEAGFPQLHGNFKWQDVFSSVRSLHEISKTLKDQRFSDGALQLENSKVSFLLDGYGTPYDCVLSERKNSNFLVEEFMLLANRTAAEIICRTYPHSALLRRHPEPNMRKLKEFEAFCSKHGLELDSSSSGSLHRSLESIREKLKDDSVLSDILISYATRPMQLAKYFCTGDTKISQNDWGHYALALPLYTHFTSPLRRYPDVVVHRTMAAALEAEEMYLKRLNIINEVNLTNGGRCFTGVYFDKLAAESEEGQEALAASAVKHKIPCTEILSDVAAYCNGKKLASRHVKEAVDRLYMWIMLKNKEVLISEARVLGLGPRFMSVYIHKLAIERRINYDDVEGLMVEWFEATSTVVLSFYPNKRVYRRGSPGKFKALEEMAWVISSCDLKPATEESATHNGDSSLQWQSLDLASKSGGSASETDPAHFPLTVRLLSTIPVALHAVGGDDGPLDICARLYMTTYFR